MLKNKCNLVLTFVVFAINLFFQDWKVLGPCFAFCLLWAMAVKVDFRKHGKKLWILVFFYLSTFLLQIFYHQEGKVLFRIFHIYITQEGLVHFLGNFFRIAGLLVLSWIVSHQKIFYGRFGKYQELMEEVIEAVPQVLVLFKKKMKIKWFFRYILRKSRKCEEE